MDVVTLDPGGTTGWTWWDNYSPVSTFQERFDHGELGPEKKQHHTALETFLYQAKSTADSNASGLVIVCERFDNRAHEAAELISVEYIGVVKLFCAKTQTRLLFQDVGNMKEWNKSKGKSYGKLRALNLYESSSTHSTDSNGHMLYYLVNNWAHLEAVQPIMRALEAYINGHA